MRRILLIISVYIVLSVLNTISAKSIDTTAFYSNQILSCPTDNSITIRILPRKALNIYFEYGTSPGVYSNLTSTVTTTAEIPVQFILSGLTSNTRYFYRLRYKLPNEQSFIIGDMCTFITHRPRGSMFTFTINGDSHLYDKKGVPSVMRQTMSNIGQDNPDFHFELGDTYGDDRNPLTIDSVSELSLKKSFLQYIGLIAHSASYYFVMGNHEGENAWYLTQPRNLYLWGTLARKFYYAMPEPYGFYSGNDSTEGSGMGKPQDYYSFEWGDALFVILDEYRFCTSDAMPGQWNWTLGQRQFNWFKQTLQNSTAKYKFVFAHHVTGYGRGGVIMANQFEWGDSVHFNQYRTGWGGVPIHQIMAQNHVNVFFDGHDHLFATEQANGVYYQEIGMPSDSTYQIGWLANADAYTGPNKFDGSGYIRVTVGPNEGKVEYVSTYKPQDTNSINHNHSVRFSYTFSPHTSVNESGKIIPDEPTLEQNYPNPFNPTTLISFTLPERTQVSLSVFDAAGHEIQTLVNSIQNTGEHEIKWDATKYPSGVYFYKIITDGYTNTKKMLLIK